MWKKSVLKRRANARLERQNVEGMDIPYFKITFDDVNEDTWLRFRIVPAGRYDGRIFWTLKQMYLDWGMGNQEATTKANNTVVDFYKAASKCSENWSNPFKVYITHYDKSKRNKVKNSFND